MRETRSSAKRTMAQNAEAGTRRKALGPGVPDPKRSKAQNPWAERVRQARVSQALIPIEAGPAAEMMWNIREALLPYFDPATLRALRLVCKLTCKAVDASAICLTWEGSENREVYKGTSQTAFPKCPNLDRVRGHYPHTYLALADLPTHLTSLEVAQTGPYLTKAECKRNVDLLQDADSSPLTALTRLEKAVLNGLPASKIAQLDLGNALRSLDLSGSLHLTCIPALKVLPSLNALSATSYNLSKQLRNISALSQCFNLHTLELVGAFRDISALSKCSNLHTLKLVGGFHDISALSKCSSLRTLNMDASKVKDISPLALCSSLHTLALDVEELHDIDALSACSNLHTLTLRMIVLEDATALSRCLSLRVLKLHLENVVDIALSSSLQSLRVDSSHLGILSGCPNLSALELFVSQEYVDLSPLSACTNLHELRMYYHVVVNIEYLSAHLNLVNLNELHIHGSSRDSEFLGDISALSKCANLHKLSLSGCPDLGCPFFEVESLKGLSSCSNLCALDLSGSCSLVSCSLNALSRCTNLNTLDLSHCLNLENIKALSKLSNLQSLDLSQCWQLKSIAVLSSCANLHTLSLAGCQYLEDKNIQALSSCSNLTSLELSGVALQSTKALSECSKLSYLGLSQCILLSNIWDLPKCGHLRELDLYGSRLVQNLEPLIECSNLRKLHLTRATKPVLHGIGALSANIQITYDHQR